jgi:hypothetical protein
MRSALLSTVTLLAATAAWSEVQPGGRLPEVKTVYLLPMSYGFDQFLANRLTQEGVARVVTHPRDADAVFTDVVGPGLDRKLHDLFPDLFRDPDAPPVSKQEGEQPKDVKVMNPEDAPRSTFGRTKGNYFLLDFRSGQVLWSTYERPKTFQPDDLDKASGRVVRRLARDIEREQQKRK